MHYLDKDTSGLLNQDLTTKRKDAWKFAILRLELFWLFYNHLWTSAVPVKHVRMFNVDKVSSILTFSRGIAKKVSPKTLKKSPTTHVTDISFLHVCDHVGAIYIFDIFLPISTFGLSFFQQIRPKKVRVQS